MIDSWFLKSIIRKKYAFPNSYQEKVPKEVFLLWAKIRFEVFQPSKSQEINNERRVFYQLHIWNGLRPGDICSGNSQGHDLDFQLAEDTGIIWNVLTMAAPGVPGDLEGAGGVWLEENIQVIFIDFILFEPKRKPKIDNGMISKLFEEKWKGTSSLRHLCCCQSFSLWCMGLYMESWSIRNCGAVFM